MAMDNRQLEDFDDFSEFENNINQNSSDFNQKEKSKPNEAMAWRRELIEKAAINVKNASSNKIDPKKLYLIGSLVYDGKRGKFGRVMDSSPGLLNVSLLNGETLVLKSNEDKTTIQQISQPVVKEEKTPAIVIKADAPVKREKTIKIEKKVPSKKRKDSSIKVQTKSKNKDKSPITFTQMLPKGATTDPVVDPNGYIQQNFLLMSNKELATATGLSEHTIRRKLGEWNLKRKDFNNKA